MSGGPVFGTFMVDHEDNDEETRGLILLGASEGSHGELPRYELFSGDCDMADASTQPSLTALWLCEVASVWPSGFEAAGVHNGEHIDVGGGGVVGMGGTGSMDGEGGFDESDEIGTSGEGGTGADDSSENGDHAGSLLDRPGATSSRAALWTTRTKMWRTARRAWIVPRTRTAFATA